LFGNRFLSNKIVKVMSVELRTKPLKGGKKSLYLDIYQNGNRSYEFLKIYLLPEDIKNREQRAKNKAENKENTKIAENIKAKRQIEVNNEEYGFIPSHRKNADFIAYFQHYTDTNKKAGNRKFISTLKQFKTFIKKDKLPFKQLDKRVCEDFYNYLKEDAGLKGATPTDYFKRFRTVINKAVRYEIINKNPCSFVKVKTPSITIVPKNILVEEELQILTKTYCGNPETKRAFFFACYTGLGESEIKKLKWSSIQDGRIKTKRSKNGRPVFNKLSKTALKLLGVKGKPEEYIFELPSTTAINQCIKNWLKRSNIDKHITFYCARHTFAVRVIRKTGNLKVTANAMSHTSTKHTEKYLNFLEDLTDDAMDLDDIGI